MADNRYDISSATAAAHRRARWVAVVMLLAVILIVFSLLQLCSAPGDNTVAALDDSVLVQKITDAHIRVDSLGKAIAADPAQADRAAIPMMQAIMDADSAARALGYKPYKSLHATAQAAVATARRSLEAQSELYDDIGRLKARYEQRLARLDSVEAIFSKHCKSFTSHAL